MTETFHMRLDKLKNEAIDAYYQIKQDKNYPHPINMPIGLFDYLENGRLETAYTRTLAYLLDAKAPHGYGDKILKNLLAYYNINCKNLDFCVYPEYRFNQKAKHPKRFDIFIQGKADGKPFVVVIEAKTVSIEGKQQLANYDNYLEKNFAKEGTKVIKIYLTIDADEPSQDSWRKLSWLDIIQILNSCIKIEKKQDNLGYDFIRYYISSIYSQLYGHNANYLNIYQLLKEKTLQSYAIELQNENFDFNTFQQYPSALLMLYQYTPKGCNFDESFEIVVQTIKEKISNFLTQYNIKSLIHNPYTWNKYIEIGSKEYLNIGITNRVLVKDNSFNDGLWWFANINFESLENKLQNIEKYKQKEIEEKYKNSDINISGHNIIFFMQKYKNNSSPQLKLDKILGAKKSHNDI